MKRKIIIACAIILLAVWGLFFALDYHAVTNLRDPVIAQHVGAEGGTFCGIGWTVEIEKIHATENGTDMGWITESAEIYLFGILVGAAIT